MNRRVRLVMILSMSAMLPGCGAPAGPQRTEVSGKVTYKGEPIVDGEIKFVPEAGSKATPGAGVIKDGEYKLVGNQGLVAGAFRVEFYAYKPRASNELSPGGLDRPQSVGIPNREQFLPDKFQKGSAEKVIVEAGKPVTKDFALME